MESKSVKAVKQSNTESKCVHIKPNLGLCQCKAEMEAKYQEFKVKSGEVFKDQLKVHMKKSNEFAANILKKNHELTKEKKEYENDNYLLRQHVDALQKLSENIVKQNELIELRADTQHQAIGQLKNAVECLTNQNKDLQASVEAVTSQNQDLTNQNKDLQASVEGLTNKNKDLQAAVEGLTNQNKDLQATVKDLLNENNSLQKRVKCLEEK